MSGMELHNYIEKEHSLTTKRNVLFLVLSEDVWHNCYMSKV